MNQPYDLAPDDHADQSVRKILRRLFAALRSNVDGVVEDADIDFLHDLRVANRRTRTALSQIKGVLPTAVLETYQPEFKWLGDVTGPCRDLDVFSIAIEDSLQRSPIDDDALRPLKDFLGAQRRTEHDLVRVALQSNRFRLLVEGWDRLLESPSEGKNPRLASTPIIDGAGPQILKAYRRIRKRGSGIDVDPSADLLHRLRIDAKKLRYLLEFFSDLYPLVTVSRLIGELKQLQDILGDFSDTEVQLAIIRKFADCGAVSAETLAATSSLAETITERQRLLRSDIAERFGLFTSDESRKLYRKTFRAP